MAESVVNTNIYKMFYDIGKMGLSGDSSTQKWISRFHAKANSEKARLTGEGRDAAWEKKFGEPFSAESYS